MRYNQQMRISENLKYLRKSFGYTQQGLANNLHINRSRYSLYETGRNLIPTEVLLNLAELYQIRVDTILQINSKRLDNDVIFNHLCQEQIDKLIQMFHQLSPFSQACLLEDACGLVEKEKGKNTIFLDA